MERVAFITGFPAFTAKRMIEKFILEDNKVFFLVRNKFFEDAKRFISSIKKIKNAAKETEILIGDVAELDAGLSGKEVRKLRSEVQEVHHIASIFHLGVSKEIIYRVNVNGTKNMLELAKAFRNLKRFNLFSTAFVSGKREGVILEDELDCGQGFSNYYEETKFLAENLARKASNELKISIFRPSIIVGDSKTGEIDKLDGPYFLINAIVNLPLDIRIPLPAEGNYPLNMVPVDFVIDASYFLSNEKSAEGKTFHLTDPNPLPARLIFEIVAEKVHKKKPGGKISPSAFKLLKRIPFVEKIFAQQLEFIEHLNKLTIFNCSNTLKLLYKSGIACPFFIDYINNLINFLKLKYKTEQEKKMTSLLEKKIKREEEEDVFY